MHVVTARNAFAERLKKHYRLASESPVMDLIRMPQHYGEGDYFYGARDGESFLAIKAALSTLYPGERDARVLQLACGYGQLEFYVGSNIKLAMLDISRGNIKWGMAHGASGGI